MEFLFKEISSSLINLIVINKLNVQSDQITRLISKKSLNGEMTKIEFKIVKLIGFKYATSKSLKISRPIF